MMDNQVTIPSQLIYFTTTLCLLLLLFNNASASEETSQVVIEKSESVKITGITDWEFGAYTAKKQTTETIDTVNNDTCVYSSTGAYTLSITSANSSSDFLSMISETGDEIYYFIKLTATKSNGQMITRYAGSPTVVKENLPGSTDLFCTDKKGASNLSFQVSIRTGSYNRAPPGAYRDSLTIMVSSH